MRAPATGLLHYFLVLAFILALPSGGLVDSGGSQGISMTRDPIVNELTRVVLDAAPRSLCISNSQNYRDKNVMA